MKNLFVIDLHTDIATNVLEATGKNITKRHSLHNGNPRISGVVANNNIDLPRLRDGGVRLVFTSLFGLDEKSYQQLIGLNQSEYNFKKLENTKFGFEAILEQLSYYHGIFQKYKDQISIIKSKKDYLNLLKTKKIGFVIHIEGADYIDKEGKILEALYTFGVRSIGLTWRNRNLFASGNNVSGGLTKEGRSLIDKINNLGMILDLAHTNKETFSDIIKFVNYPIIVSHTLVDSICNNSRNLTDDQIKSVAKLGGVMGMAAIPDYIGGSSLEDYVDHFEYILKLVGDDFISFGTDFDGLVGAEDTFMENFTGADGFPNIIKVFKKRGFTDKTIEKICYRNAERLIKTTLV